MITSKRIKYKFGETTEFVQFFKNEDKYRAHLVKHFLSANEPWERLFGRKELDRIRGKMRRNEVIDIQKVYDDTVAILDAGIEYSTNRPVFVEFYQRIEQEDRGWHERGRALLAEKGFIVTVVHDRVVSAYFVQGPSDRPYVTLYKEAWEKLHTKFGKRKYIDDDTDPHRTVENVDINFVSESEWDHCINPHKNKRARPFKPDGERWEYEFDLVDPRG